MSAALTCGNMTQGALILSPVEVVLTSKPEIWEIPRQEGTLLWAPMSVEESVNVSPEPSSWEWKMSLRVSASSSG